MRYHIIDDYSGCFRASSYDLDHEEEGFHFSVSGHDRAILVNHNNLVSFRPAEPGSRRASSPTLVHTFEIALAYLASRSFCPFPFKLSCAQLAVRLKRHKSMAALSRVLVTPVWLWTTPRRFGPWWHRRQQMQRLLRGVVSYLYTLLVPDILAGQMIANVEKSWFAGRLRRVCLNHDCHYTLSSHIFSVTSSMQTSAHFRISCALNLCSVRATDIVLRKKISLIGNVPACLLALVVLRHSLAEIGFRRTMDFVRQIAIVSQGGQLFLHHAR